MEDSDYNDTDEKRLTVVSSAKMVQRIGNHISRRSFTKSVTRIIGLGTLSHFSLLANNLQAEEITNSDDDCPGGGDADDICNPPDNRDKCPGGEPSVDQCFTNEVTGDDDTCPGENSPADECPTTGERAFDLCETGAPDPADICLASEEGSDQCESGISADDECAPTDASTKLDYCPTGQSPDPDACASDGGKATDECPGGGSSNGIDTCAENGDGDECSDEQPPADPDACREGITSIDSCIDESADICPDGTPSTTGYGYGDICGEAYPHGPVGSDQCPDGSPENDKCEMVSSTIWDPDVCPGGGTNVDVCNPNEGIPAPNSDYCLSGLPATDECNPSVGDEDECPGGANDPDECVSGTPEEDECPGGQPEVDNCPTGEAPEDECTAAGGCSGGDQETSIPVVDVCLIPVIDGCALISNDTAE